MNAPIYIIHLSNWTKIKWKCI